MKQVNHTEDNCHKKSIENINYENKRSEYIFEICVLLFGIICFLAVIVMGIIGIIQKNKIAISIGQIIVGVVLMTPNTVAVIVLINGLRQLKKIGGE